MSPYTPPTTRRRLGQRRPGRRAGVTILEGVSSLVLLSVLLTLIAKMTVLIDHQSELRWQQRLASATLSNLMEHATALEWDQLTTDALTTTLQPQLESTKLPDAQLQVDVSQPPESDDAKQITLSLGWSPVAAGRPQQRGLTAFVYQQPEVNE